MQVLNAFLSLIPFVYGGFLFPQYNDIICAREQDEVDWIVVRPAARPLLDLRRSDDDATLSCCSAEYD